MRSASEFDAGLNVEVDVFLFCCFDACPFSGVLFRVTEESSISSGIVANFLRTCLRAGRRIGLL